MSRWEVCSPDLLVAAGGEQLGASPVPAGGVDEVGVAVQRDQSLARAHVPYCYLEYTTNYIRIQDLVWGEGLSQVAERKKQGFTGTWGAFGGLEAPSFSMSSFLRI